MVLLLVMRQRIQISWNSSAMLALNSEDLTLENVRPMGSGVEKRLPAKVN